MKMPEDMVEKNDSNKLAEVERKLQQGRRTKVHIMTEYTWDISVKRRRVTQSQTAQSTVTLHEDKNIYEIYINFRILILFEVVFKL